MNREITYGGGEILKVQDATPGNETALIPFAGKKQGTLYYLRRDWLYFLLLIPLAFVLVFKYAPMSGLVLAFKDYKIAHGFWSDEWVGLEVFKDIFAKPDFARAIRNTLLLNVSDLIFSFTMPIILSFAKRSQERFLQTRESDSALFTALSVLGHYRRNRLSIVG